MQELRKETTVTEDLMEAALRIYEDMSLREGDLEEEEMTLSDRYKENMKTMCKFYDIKFPE